MNWRIRFLGVALGAMSGVLMAQQATSAPSTATTTTGTQIVTGTVVQYSPGRSIALRGADGRTTNYMLGSSVQAPAGVEIGRVVTLSTESGTTGSHPAVTRIEVKTSNPADTAAPSAASAPSAWSGSPSGATGRFSSSSETAVPSGASGSPSAVGTSGIASPSAASSPSASSEQDASSGRPGSGAPTTSGQSSDIPPSSGLSSGTRDSLTGKVTAYAPKQSITIEQPGKGTVTYTIDTQSDLPQDVAVGKTVTVTTRTVAGDSKPVVKTVTTTTRTTKTTTESHPQ